MNARFKRPLPVRQVGASCFSDLALCCARNLYKASNRRMPEAQALAIWLGRAASTFGLTDAAVPELWGVWARRASHWHGRSRHSASER